MPGSLQDLDYVCQLYGGHCFNGNFVSSNKDYQRLSPQSETRRARALSPLRARTLRTEFGRVRTECVDFRRTACVALRQVVAHCARVHWMPSVDWLLSG